LLEKVPELQPLTEFEQSQVGYVSAPVLFKKVQTMFVERYEEAPINFVVDKQIIIIERSTKSGDQEFTEIFPGEYLRGIIKRVLVRLKNLVL
ncbi:hypothetical protein AVEN_78377-1, partial [Araneus ventricosus]